MKRGPGCCVSHCGIRPESLGVPRVLTLLHDRFVPLQGPQQEVCRLCCPEARPRVHEELALSSAYSSCPGKRSVLMLTNANVASRDKNLETSLGNILPAP